MKISFNAEEIKAIVAQHISNNFLKERVAALDEIKIGNEFSEDFITWVKPVEEKPKDEDVENE